MSETNTVRVTAESWVDLDVGATIITIQNVGTRTAVFAVGSAAPSASTWLGKQLKPGCDPVRIELEGSDNVYARVNSSQMVAKTTIAWHETDPPA